MRWTRTAAYSLWLVALLLLLEASAQLPRGFQPPGEEAGDPASQEASREHERFADEFLAFSFWLNIESAGHARAFLRDHMPFAFRDALTGAAEREFRAVNGAAMAELGGFIASSARDHPPADSLLDAAREAVVRAKEFVGLQQIVALPAAADPAVRAMPRYVVGSFASMSAPGPFETRAAEAYYEMKLPAPGWAPEHVEQHLAYFNRPGLLGITIHETLPGHFVQLLALRQAPSRVRKAFAPASLAEGWAHYVEEMMLDQEFGESDPRLRIAQLRRALQHLARLRAGILMHARGAGVEDAAREVADIAYLEPFPALRETERGTYDPLYGADTLGKMQLLKLRYDYQRYLQRRGEPYTLRVFHDRLLGTGAPIPVARKILMPGDTARSLE